MGQECLRGLVLRVITPTAGKGPIPHIAAAIGIMWPDVYDTLWQLAELAARALEAVDGNGTISYGAACPLPARVRHL